MFEHTSYNAAKYMEDDEDIAIFLQNLLNPCQKTKTTSSPAYMMQ